MTRLELIAEICKKMAQELKEDNDRAEQKELQENRDIEFVPHVMRLSHDE